MQLHLRCESSFTSDSPYTLVVQQQHEICYLHHQINYCETARDRERSTAEDEISETTTKCCHSETSRSWDTLLLHLQRDSPKVRLLKLHHKLLEVLSRWLFKTLYVLINRTTAQKHRFTQYRTWPSAPHSSAATIHTQRNSSVLLEVSCTSTSLN